MALIFEAFPSPECLLQQNLLEHYQRACLLPPFASASQRPASCNRKFRPT